MSVNRCVDNTWIPCPCAQLTSMQFFRYSPGKKYMRFNDLYTECQTCFQIHNTIQYINPSDLQKVRHVIIIFLGNTSQGHDSKNEQ